ncbi:zinc ribbon domain-containing protein [Candidatus Saccharibacteria bacterium]|nr:zinc ribbon domain-containing protein [Candidatus Saccharibacteria bacterium]
MFCTKCSNKNKKNDNFCAKCGKKIEKTSLPRKKETISYPIAVKVLVVKAISQHNMLTLKPKLPYRYSTKTATIIVVVLNPFLKARELSQETKQNIADQIKTDVGIDEIVWVNETDFNYSLSNRGWICCIGNHIGWLLFAANGSDTLKVKDFTILKKPVENAPVFYSKSELDEENSHSDVIWIIVAICLIIMVALLINYFMLG